MTNAGVASLANMWNRGTRVSAIDVADLEGNGDLNVLAGTEGWFVNAFAPDGELLDGPNGFDITPSPRLQAADVDGDGKAEILVGTEYYTPLTVHNFDGSFRWSTFEQVGIARERDNAETRHLSETDGTVRPRQRRRSGNHLRDGRRLDLRRQSSGRRRTLAYQSRGANYGTRRSGWRSDRGVRVRRAVWNRFCRQSDVAPPRSAMDPCRRRIPRQ